MCGQQQTTTAPCVTDDTHVVCSQVDERCVRAAADTHSNLFELDRQLLRFVAVPWSHVHAMPVDVAGRLCDPELQGRPASLASLGLRASLASLDLGPLLPHWALGPLLPHWVLGPLSPHWVLEPVLPPWILGPLLPYWILGPLLPHWILGPLLPHWILGSSLASLSCLTGPLSPH